MTSHLDDGTIHELLDGEIPSRDLAPLQDHLASCAECRARLDVARLSVAESDDLIEALDVPSPARNVVTMVPTPASPRAWIRHVAWAASLVIAVGAGYYARGGPAGVGEPASVDTTSRVATIEPQPAPAAADAATEAKAGSATPTAGATRSRESLRSDASPVAADKGVRLSAPAPTPALAEATPQRDSAATLPTDRIGNVLALQPGVMASPIAGAAGAAPSVTAGVPVVRGTTSEMLARDQAAGKQIAADTISFVDAVRRLGGRLLLIEGLVPVRLEAAGRAVRVIYRVNGGELVLQQSFVNGAPVITLTAPSGFPADSLDVLRRKIHE